MDNIRSMYIRWRSEEDADDTTHWRWKSETERRIMPISNMCCCRVNTFGGGNGLWNVAGSWVASFTRVSLPQLVVMNVSEVVGQR